MRFRLRFMMQEFDVTPPAVLIGRSSECHITVEDPLISRKHARIDLRAEGAVVVDLGSRNGVRVNGRLVKGEQLLKDGDKIRLGSQELAFSTVVDAPRAPRPTGYMRLCNACGTPYPEGAPSCSHCGAPALADEDTITGAQVEPRRGWTFHLMTEVIDRALESGRAVEAERLMRKAAREVDERIAKGDALEGHDIPTLSTLAIRLAKLVGSTDWIAWVFALHRRHESMLSDVVIDALVELDLRAFPDLTALLDSFLAWYRARQTRGLGTVTGEVARLVRLERYRRG